MLRQGVLHQILHCVQNKTRPMIHHTHAVNLSDCFVPLFTPDSSVVGETSRARQQNGTMLALGLAKGKIMNACDEILGRENLEATSICAASTKRFGSARVWLVDDNARFR